MRYRVLRSQIGEFLTYSTRQYRVPCTATLTPDDSRVCSLYPDTRQSSTGGGLYSLQLCWYMYNKLSRLWRCDHTALRRGTCHWPWAAHARVLGQSCACSCTHMGATRGCVKVCVRLAEMCRERDSLDCHDAAMTPLDSAHGRTPPRFMRCLRVRPRRLAIAGSTQSPPWRAAALAGSPP